MRRYLLDTGILVHYARQSQLYREIEEKEKLSESDCLPMISIVAYGEILSFGMQNSWGSNPLGTSAITMGKNDLWIAATAKVANATLITVDSDFAHLHGKFIQVKKY